jgi:hypothetical protein
MKHVKLYEDFLNEATTSWSNMMKGVRAGGSGPWSIVAIQDRKVVGQSIDIKIQDLIPAKYEALKKEFPKAKLHIEDGGGMVVWTGPLNEGVSMDAVYIHQITGCGQDAAQNFIDDNDIDGAKLAAYVKQHRNSKEQYDVRDIIAGTGVGKIKDFRERFIKSVQESHYAFLGGNSNFTDEEMRKNIVEPTLGTKYDAYIMFDGPKGEYDKMKAKYASKSDSWKNLWRSSSHQSYADISPDGKVIKASVFAKGGIVGAIYVKSVQGSKINEGHDGVMDKAPGASKEEATKKLQSWIDSDKEEGGDLKKFVGVKWVGTMSEDGLDKLAMKYEDAYIVLGMVDNELTYAWSRRS